MVTFEKHDFNPDPLNATALCTICKMPKQHPVHKMDIVKGTAVPTKLG